MRFLMISALVLTLAGCSGNVITDYNSSVVFGNYATWAFAQDAGSGSFMSLDGSRVQNAVERELKRKAMRQVTADEADLLANWQIVEEDRLEQTGVGVGFGYGWSNFGWGLAAPPPVREVTEGKLVVELVDTDINEVVWRAVSRRYLTEHQSPETRHELIDEVVAEMFSKYPPGLE
ncbi:DUF4136 domain-containing protein [Marinobacter sp. F4206]|uniref:DUF4136 domain-containing protein n=1 Tax=Marinobacter sp. F4206 TaxID=2861777 RepID=UPI001C5F1029|nr:DUF4136 domain-containing protein [Marinobacter sp. F4206]MBW4933981.1 DUF4136 domain-containing protein [Marinobacter sp. F4206]